MALAHVITMCSCDPSNLMKPAPSQNNGTTTFTLFECVRPLSMALANGPTYWYV
jgi:hypothetical protein